MTYFVYILRTNKGTLYVGQTNNLERRVEEHTKGKYGAKYLRMFESFELVFAEKHVNRSAAMRREAEIKKLTKKQKEAMMTSFCYKSKEFT